VSIASDRHAVTRGELALDNYTYRSLRGLVGIESRRLTGWLDDLGLTTKDWSRLLQFVEVMRAQDIWLGGV